MKKLVKNICLRKLMLTSGGHLGLGVKGSGSPSIFFKAMVLCSKTIDDMKSSYQNNRLAPDI